MDRNKLIKTLEVVSRALERNNVLPIFEYFCFTGETVFAWNDAFGIVGLCKVKQPFACHGPRLLDWLKATKSDTVEMDVKNDQLLLKADKSEYTLPANSADEFSWKEPEFQAKVYDIDIIKGIEYCLPTCSDNLALEAFSRVCIGSKDGKIVVYSTDGDALTKYTTDTEGVADVCLAKDFCSAVAKTGSGALKVGTEWVCSLFEDYKVYGRNLGKTTFEYENNIGKILGAHTLDLVPIPLKLNDALTRARVVSDVETSPSTLFVENGVLTLLTDTPFGEVFDDMKVKHPDVEAQINAKLLQTTMEGCTEFKVLDNCCVFKGEKVLRLVSNM